MRENKPDQELTWISSKDSSEDELPVSEGVSYFCGVYIPSELNSVLDKVNAGETSVEWLRCEVVIYCKAILLGKLSCFSILRISISPRFAHGLQTMNSHAAFSSMWIDCSPLLMAWPSGYEIMTPHLGGWLMNVDGLKLSDPGATNRTCWFLDSTYFCKDVWLFAALRVAWYVKILPTSCSVSQTHHNGNSLLMQWLMLGFVKCFYYQNGGLAYVCIEHDPKHLLFGACLNPVRVGKSSIIFWSRDPY